MLPSGDAVVVVSRGNAAKDSRPEDPGSLRVFSLNNGQLSPLTSVAPNGGYGFGPRHLDFHPIKPWLYVSLETQNLMHMYHMSANFLAPLPTYVKPTLADYSGRRRRQRPGTIHVHPNGRFVYVANRASGTRDINGQQVFIGGENSIAVFEIDQNSGEPNAIQHVDTRGIVPRTFALDKTGRLLVVANSVSILTQENGASRTVPTSLSVFKVDDDGKLSFVKKYDIETGNESIHWMGIVG
jgi:6-phosphogluconolactonase (cycloisomerase 2 family)